MRPHPASPPTQEPGSLARGSVAQVKDGTITRALGHVVIAMRHYPRFLPKNLVHEYAKTLSPEAALFHRYREFKKHSPNQNQAFQLAGYEQSFILSEAGMKDLERLAIHSKMQPVYLVCQCSLSELCHVDLMLLIAQKHFQAQIGPLTCPYPDFQKRLEGGL